MAGLNPSSGICRNKTEEKKRKKDVDPIRKEILIEQVCAILAPFFFLLGSSAYISLTGLAVINDGRAGVDDVPLFFFLMWSGENRAGIKES